MKREINRADRACNGESEDGSRQGALLDSGPVGERESHRRGNRQEHQRIAVRPRGHDAVGDKDAEEHSERLQAAQEGARKVKDWLLDDTDFLFRAVEIG
jgi:hypothetical protein